ncbi:MAG: hypothetical protein SGILL_005032, partial [Bacillariaceae sp.]
AVIGTQLPECIVENEETDMEKCGSEGVDNSVLAWSTSYFIANVIAFLGLHVCWKSTQRFTAGVAFGLITLAMVFNGIIANFYGNSGTDDGQGMKGYYILASMFYILMTGAAFLLAFVGHRSWQLIEGPTPKFCGRTEMFLFLILLTLAAVVVVFGCISTLTKGNDVIVDNVFDEFPEDQYAVPLSLEFLNIGAAVWNACFSCFLIALAVVWGFCAREDPIIVAGMPNSMAAGGIVLIQLVVGIYRAVLLAMENTEDDDVRDSIAYRAAPVIIHYGIMISAFFAHNLIVSIFPKYEDDLYDPKQGVSVDAEDIEANGAVAVAGAAGTTAALGKGRSVDSESDEQEEIENGDKMKRANSDMTGTSQGTDLSAVASLQAAGGNKADEKDVESQGVEVVGHRANENEPNIQETSGFFSRMTRNFRKPKDQKNVESLNYVSRNTNAVDKDRKMNDDASECSDEDTSFGSLVFQKIVRKPTYESGSDTSFGSMVYTKVARKKKSTEPQLMAVSPNIDVPVHEEERALDENDDQTSFGSQVFTKVIPRTARNEKPKIDNEDADSAQTSFGSQVFTKVKPQQVRVDNDNADSDQTSFGSQVFTKLKSSSVENGSGKMKSEKPASILKSSQTRSAVPIAARTVKEDGSVSVLQSNETSFGSMVLKKVEQKPVANETGSETSFGSTKLQTVKKKTIQNHDGDSMTENPGIEVQAVSRASSMKSSRSFFARAASSFRRSRTAVDNDGTESKRELASNQTSFGSQVLEKIPAKKLVYESASETTFGSDVLPLANVKHVANDPYSLTEDAGIEVVGLEASRKMTGQEALDEESSFGSEILPLGLPTQADRDDESEQTSFGSQVLQLGLPTQGRREVESEQTSFGSQVLHLGLPTQGRREVESEQTSFGSEVLHLGRPTGIEYDVVSEQTSFGSEVLNLGLPDHLKPKTGRRQTPSVAKSVGVELSLSDLPKSEEQSMQSSIASRKTHLERPDHLNKSKEESQQTSFGSQVLQLVRPKPMEYQEASETTFGSEVLRIKKPVGDEASETTFGSEILRLKTSKNVKSHQSTTEESASETSFGSEILRFKKPANGIRAADELGYESARDSAKTTFGSEILQKVEQQQIQWEEGSVTTFGSELLTPLRAVIEEASQTTFGSELLQPIRVKSKHPLVEVEGSTTTFGSEQLKKSSFVQQVPGGARNVAFNTTGSVRSSTGSLRSNNSVRSKQSSIRPGTRAVDPAHLKMDSVYGWMTSFMPVEGADNPTQLMADDGSSRGSNGVKEEFEVQLAPKIKKEPSKKPAAPTQDASPTQSGARLRPTRQKKSKRSKRSLSQQALDIPTPIEEADDEISTDGSSIARSATSGSTRDLKRGGSVASKDSSSKISSPQPYEVKEQFFKAAPTPVEKQVTGAVASYHEPLKDPEPLERENASNASSDYSVDNSTLVTGAPIDEEMDPLQSMPSDLMESRDDDDDDDDFSDSDEEASQSYADSTIPSAFKNMHNDDDVSKASSKASSKSSWMYDDVGRADEPEGRVGGSEIRQNE